MTLAYLNDQEKCIFCGLPQHVAVQEEGLQLQYLLQHDQLHVVQLQPSHFLST